MIGRCRRSWLVSVGRCNWSERAECECGLPTVKETVGPCGARSTSAGSVEWWRELRNWVWLTGLLSFRQHRCVRGPLLEVLRQAKREDRVAK